MSRRAYSQQILAVFALMVALLLPDMAMATVTIKLATLAPEGSTWHKGLRQMADEWSEITHGEVEVKIYAGGVVGNETVMLRKMRIGQLHGGAVTNSAFLEIEPSAQVIQTPMLIRDNDELDYVMTTMGPEFERRIEANGFKVLNWGDAGWVHMFTKTPLTQSSHVGDHKMFAWEGDPAAVEMYRKGGFRPVVIAVTDMMPSLQSGMIDAFPATPLTALAFQWFALAPNMMDLPWAPLMGATILTDDAWAMIPAQYHDALLASARRTGEGIKGQVRSQDTKAVEVMKKYGLTVNHVDDAERALWISGAEATYPIVREKMVPPEIFDQTKALVEQYRAAHP
ncbi:MAG: TRAP transporter substrate-binding protein DctP [Deltaproteobacteria bacterium]|nr:TRAP transporter substrate-binding protein DctP [Deltaproteobacteria bacterium]